MGKQTRSRKSEVIGKGKVTPVQVAFIVDRYLSDNGFAQTRSVFRSEASNLISKSPVQEAPKTLLSLGAILDDYITLKEQKVALDQERSRLDQEKLRVQNLLSGMQDVMNAYNSGANNAVTVTPPPLLPPAAVPSGAVSQADLAATTPAGYYPMHATPAIMSTSKPSSSQKDSAAYSTPTVYNTVTKRRGSKDVLDGQVIPKRSRRNIQPKDANLVGQTSCAGKNQDRSQVNSTVQLLDCSKAPSGSQVQGSNVVKCLFNQETDPASPPANSSVPKTPPLASSQTEKACSPLECSTATSNNGIAQQILSANCTIISSETIRVSPTKQIAYYTIEKNSISACSPLKKCSPVNRSNIKDHVKGRLDFGTSEMPLIPENQTPEFNTTSESEKETGILDLDFPNLDAFGLDFNLSEFLETFDIGTDGMAFSSEQALASSPDSISGTPSTTGNIEQFSSSIAGVFEHKDMNLDGTESVEAMRSVTTCIRIVSPAKTRRCNLNQ